MNSQGSAGGLLIHRCFQILPSDEGCKEGRGDVKATVRRLRLVVSFPWHLSPCGIWVV